MSTPYETREKEDEKRIAEAEKRQEQTVQRYVKEVAGSKVVVKEDPDTGLVQQTKISGGSWSR